MGGGGRGLKQRTIMCVGARAEQRPCQCRQYQWSLITATKSIATNSGADSIGHRELQTTNWPNYTDRHEKKFPVRRAGAPTFKFVRRHWPQTRLRISIVLLNSEPVLIGGCDWSRTLWCRSMRAVCVRAIMPKCRDGVFRVSTFPPYVLVWGFSVVVGLTKQQN